MSLEGPCKDCKTGIYVCVCVYEVGEVAEEPDGLLASKRLSALNNEVSGLYFTEGLGFTPHPFVSQRQAIRPDKAEPSLINILRRSRLKWGGSQNSPSGSR